MVIDLLKPTLAARCSRLRRYRESNLRRKQNNIFQTNERIFYRSIQTENTQQDKQNEVPSFIDKPVLEYHVHAKQTSQFKSGMDRVN